MNEGNPSASNVHAYLSHMQRHIVRRDQGKGNKCSRCCLWFNQKSALITHQRELHDHVSNPSMYLRTCTLYIIRQFVDSSIHIIHIRKVFLSRLIKNFYQSIYIIINYIIFYLW